MATALTGIEKQHTKEVINKDDDNHVSMSTLLILLLELSHLLLVMHREYKGQYLAPQNYTNWKDYVKSTCTSVSLNEYYNDNKHWSWTDSNQNLEELFGIVRIMKEGDMNCSILHLPIVPQSLTYI